MFAMLISTAQVHWDGSYEHMLLEDTWENLTVKGFPGKVVIGGKGKGKEKGKGKGKGKRNGKGKGKEKNREKGEEAAFKTISNLLDADQSIIFIAFLKSA